MLFEKTFIGQQTVADVQIKYYMIHKEHIYGIAIEEEEQHTTQCQHEYFTELKDSAYQLGKMMYGGQVTTTTMTAIIDDFIH